MKLKAKAILIVGVICVLVVIAGIICFALQVCNRVEPASGISTENYIFEVVGTKLIATNTQGQKTIFEGDRNGAIISAAVSPDKVYVLCDDTLYSVDADGGNKYKIATKCYNPGELASSVTMSDSTELSTLWYYDGYVYFIQYGSTSKLVRFKTGSNAITEICKNSVAAFTISTDGILTGYSNTDHLGNRSVTVELDLKSL